MKLKILESAIEDLQRAREFYARHGVGEHFLDSLFSDIDSLLLYAGIHQKVFGYHRLLAKRFPYAVYYLSEEDVAVVNGSSTCGGIPRLSVTAFLPQTKPTRSNRVKWAFGTLSENALSRPHKRKKTVPEPNGPCNYAQRDSKARRLEGGQSTYFGDIESV